MQFPEAHCVEYVHAISPSWLRQLPPLELQVLSFDASRRHCDGSCVAVALAWSHRMLHWKSLTEHAAWHAPTSVPMHAVNAALLSH